MQTVSDNVDENLVRRAQSGDRAAFEEIVRKSSRLIYARLYLEVGDPHRAEDLTQETFLSAFKSIHQLQDPKRLGAWLQSIAHKVAINAFRKNSRQKRGGLFRRVEELESVASEADEPMEGLNKREMKERVMSTLRSMPEDYRVPLMLRYFGGANYEVISRQLGLSNGSLRGLLNRGMNQLRAELKRFAQEV